MPRAGLAVLAAGSQHSQLSPATTLSGVRDWSGVSPELPLSEEVTFQRLFQALSR